jgi:mycothiol S-conjugate amidase
VERELFAVRDAALIAHATQVDPLGRWFTRPIGCVQKAWPTEGLSSSPDARQCPA